MGRSGRFVLLGVWRSGRRIWPVQGRQKRVAYPNRTAKPSRCASGVVDRAKVRTPDAQRGGIAHLQFHRPVRAAQRYVVGGAFHPVGASAARRECQGPSRGSRAATRAQRRGPGVGIRKAVEVPVEGIQQDVDHNRSVVFWHIGRQIGCRRWSTHMFPSNQN